MLAGTNAISALRDAVVIWIALKFNDNRSADESFMHGTQIVGITSFQRHLVRKCEPDLRNHGNCVFFRVVAQLGAKMEKTDRLVFPCTACLQRGTVAAKGNLHREVEREIELAKSFREDEPRLSADDLMAVLIAPAVISPEAAISTGKVPSSKKR
jgi:hypothetical protein